MIEHTCQYCKKSFRRESSLAVHVCESKRRYRERDETGVRIGMQAYLRFYELTQGSARLKTWEDFAGSPYYKAFVKFGRYCQSIRAVNVAMFADWLIKNNKKIDHWCRDAMYTEYLMYYIRIEHPQDAVARALEASLDWSEATGHPSEDFMRYGNPNQVCYAISTGRISPWVVYNTESGNKFLGEINTDQLSVIWPMIDTDFWQKKFRDYPADQEYVRELMRQAGW